MINITKISDDYIMALSALIQSAFIVEKIATSSKEIDNDLVLRKPINYDHLDSKIQEVAFI